MQNKVVIITGASSGIGKALVYEFAKRGAKIAMGARNLDELHKIETDLKSRGVDALSVQTDVTREADCKNLIEKTVERFGKIDILVNNAGISDSTKIDDYTAEQFSKVMQLNVNAIFNAVMPVSKIMKEQGGGCILNTSSMVSICGQPSGVAYPASKSAVNGLTWSLARELGPSNIRVNAVAPGITKTDMVAALPEQMIQPLINAIPLRRVGEPEDVANAFLFLASDMASYVTGEILSVDGAMRS